MLYFGSNSYSMLSDVTEVRIVVYLLSGRNEQEIGRVSPYVQLENNRGDT